MLLLMDQFAQAVEDARRRLGLQEGREVSLRELARRAGVKPSTLSYNLSEKRASSRRRVDSDLIHALAQVLPITEDDLTRAAQVAAGYQVRGDAEPDLGAAVVRYLDADERSPADKRQLLARLTEIIADEMRKDIQSFNNGSDAQ